MKEEFLIKNKQVLLEELASSLSTLNVLIGEVVESKESIDRIMVGMAYHVGNLTGLFNQYTILETKEFPETEKPIGFRSFKKED